LNLPLASLSVDHHAGRNHASTTAAINEFPTGRNVRRRGWAGAVVPPHIGTALALMHGQPADDWTLERLAREVGLSRSVFADRFAHFMQEAPVHYLTRWRMQLASHLLERQGVSVAQVAAEVGYESEAAFNRAFKKCVGIPPGAWRRERLTT
jgi:AraC-like DNA-binding protein